MEIGHVDQSVYSLVTESMTKFHPPADKMQICMIGMS